ncbi:hypothetical protein [Nonomuraea dietziae]|uniref:hypothetical protein n=1 Tax=Nonomuraea dietziae TaxID=65515 RepID=UPI00343757AD
MTAEFLVGQASLEAAARGMEESAVALRRHADALLASVRGSGLSAWGGTGLGRSVDGLADLAGEACALLRDNLHLTGAGLRAMAGEARLAEAVSAAESLSLAETLDGSRGSHASRSA